MFLENFQETPRNWKLQEKIGKSRKSLENLEKPSKEKMGKSVTSDKKEGGGPAKIMILDFYIQLEKQLRYNIIDISQTTQYK